jgi:probable F420-dependent oxidoreductase
LLRGAGRTAGPSSNEDGGVTLENPAAQPKKLAVDVQLPSDKSSGLRDAPRRAREMAATGVDGLFTFEGQSDVFFPLVAASIQGDLDLDLMTNVAMAFPRSPMHMAYAAYDLQKLSNGRFRLGLGSQIKPHIERRYGSTWSKPVARMREMVLATKAILETWEGIAPLDFRGEFTTHTLMTPNFDPGPNPFGMAKIHVGALGPKMCEMTAEVADGILVMPFNSGEHMVQRTMPAIDRGLATAGRTRDDLEVIVEVIVGVGRNDEELEAARGVRNLLAFYGSTPAYKPVLDVHGWGDLQPELNRLSKQGDWATMGTLITEDMIQTIAVHGTPDQVASEIVARYGRFSQRVCAYFPFYQAGDDLVADFTSALKAASA